MYLLLPVKGFEIIKMNLSKCFTHCHLLGFLRLMVELWRVDLVKVSVVTVNWIEKLSCVWWYCET